MGLIGSSSHRMDTYDVDVAIVGSGFGGSLTALLLERIGLRPLVLDRASHPRFTIGESSTPTANMILRDLADRYDLSHLRPLAAYGPWQEAYPEVVAGRKRGFSYFRHASEVPFTPEPRHANELLVTASSDPYWSDTHWLRADVDAFLAKEVRRAGIPLLDETEVTGLRREGRWLLEARNPEGAVQCRADFLVDATGGTGLCRAFGRTGTGPSLQSNSRALYAHFSGLPRWHDVVAARGSRVEDHPYPCDEAAVHHVLDDRWMWEFRFNDGRVSAGLVLDAEASPLDPELSPEAEWTACLQRYPTLARRFSLDRLAHPPGQIVRTGRLQRTAKQAAGPGWALLPFTAGFVDPLHSTGIAHTLSGIERLTSIFDRHGSRPPVASLHEYSRALRRELQFVDALVQVCYESLPSFRAWTASTMFYFAAATTYERRRASTREAFSMDFLCAGDATLRSRVQEALRWLSERADRPLGPDEEEAYEQRVEEAIRPYNEVGLFDPPVPNMYPYTAAPMGEES